jgi:hypothetical protein
MFAMINSFPLRLKVILRYVLERYCRAVAMISWSYYLQSQVDVDWMGGSLSFHARSAPCCCCSRCRYEMDGVACKSCYTAQLHFLALIFRVMPPACVFGVAACYVLRGRGVWGSWRRRFKDARQQHTV